MCEPDYVGFRRMGGGAKAENHFGSNGSRMTFDGARGITCTPAARGLRKPDRIKLQTPM